MYMPKIIKFLLRIWNKGKTLNEKISNLYQSQKSNFNKKGLRRMTLIFAILSCFFFISKKISGGVVDGVIFRYLIITFDFLAVLSLASYFYIYSEKKISKSFACIIIIMYKFLLIICAAVCIPIIIFLKIIQMIICYRAKKLDNLQNWLIILIIDLFVIIALSYFDILIARKVTEFIICFVKEHYKYNVIKYPLELFLILCLFKVEMDITNIIILKVMNHVGISKIERKVNERQTDNTYDYLTKDDISKYIEEKNNDIKQYQEEQKNSLRYDLEYQKKTVWKFQLVCLIILFLIATFVPEWLFAGHQGDAVNVITIFTLIMLYIDKRKEWKY